MIKAECIFCLDNNLIQPRIIGDNDVAFAMWDDYPLAAGHALIIPKNHNDNIFEITTEENNGIYLLTKVVKEVVDQQYQPKGYNLFTNIGRSAGQVVMHAHVHLVPRFNDDETAIILGDHNNPDRA